MSNLTARRVLWVCLAVLGGTPANAGLINDLSEEDPDWVEQALGTLPPLPEESALEAVKLTSDARYRHYVDRRTVTLGADGVVRFSLVVRPESGRLQSSYAGLRCQTRQWKTYAHSIANGDWRPVAAPVWEDIERKTRDNVRQELYQHFFCKGNGPGGTTPEQLLRRLRQPVREPRR